MNDDDYTGYTLTLNEGDGETTGRIRSDYTRPEVEEECKNWVEMGDWNDGSGDDLTITVDWTITDGNGDEVDCGEHEVHIPHNEKRKVKLAGGNPECSHDWERDESVGCRENPGVMGLGGTAISVTDICLECGIVRNTRHNGSQRNPGQPMKEVSYEVVSK